MDGGLIWDREPAARKRADAPAKRAAPARAPTADAVLELQRTAGNRRVMRRLLGSKNRARLLQRRIKPEDVSGELIGRVFSVTAAFSAGAVSVTSGEHVEVSRWDNASTSATVKPLPPSLHAGSELDVPKTLLRPVGPGAAGVHPYSAGLDSAVSSHARGEAAIAAEKARKGGPRPGEVPRLEGLQRRREALLNKRLIQETMLNRFDLEIKRWVDHYNTAFGRSGADALDPNLVKSMIFQESQMGTAGQHLEDPPRHPVRSRFNLAQVIDSSGAALLIMIREMEPALIATYHLERIDADLATARKELADLRKVAHPTPAQSARLTELTRLSARSWETFLWEYKAAGETDGFSAAVLDFFDVPGTDRHLDYEFWIRAAVRWLFEKRKGVKSWEEAARAYNGSGARAEHYRDAVTQRAAGAKAAAKTGGLIPAGL